MFLKLLEKTIASGKQAIVLVPEIVLTPQMMRKFASCFGSKVAMLHSSLRMTERCDQWKRIRRGEVQVVLGTRSAIFAPLHAVSVSASKAMITSNKLMRLVVFVVMSILCLPWFDLLLYLTVGKRFMQKKYYSFADLLEKILPLC